jgi:DNA-binding XRE family transcriptional regulator
MDDQDKPVVWLAGEVKTPPFSKEARLEAGVLLRRLQRGRNMAIKKDKKRKLEAAGWRVGSAADFLDLTKEEASLIEMKIGLAESIRKRRQARKLTQTHLAKRIGSSQSRVAKMEIADPSVSMDLLVRALLELGATRSQVAKAITKRSRRAA